MLVPRARAENGAAVARKRGAVGATTWAVWAVGVLVVALLGSWAWSRITAAGRPTRATSARAVRVQVLNGSGESGIATRVASFLREGGYQVVEVRNADRTDYFASMVVARRSELSNAREVAHYLGGPPLIQQSWDSELADITVLIGSDRSHLQLEP